MTTPKNNSASVTSCIPGKCSDALESNISEQAIIGSTLVAPWLLPYSMHLKPEHFSTRAMVAIWEAILACEARTPGKWDDLSVADHLEFTGKLDAVEGRSGLLSFVSAANELREAAIGTHAEVVIDRAIRRTLLMAGHAIEKHAESSKHETAKEAIAASVAELDKALNFTDPRASGATVGDLAEESIRRIEEGARDESSIGSGFASLDAISGTPRRGEVTVVAARPSVGKTSLALHLATHAAEKGLSVVFWSRETAAEKLVDRMLSQRCGVPATDIMANTVAEHHIESVKAAIPYVKELGIKIYDRGGGTVEDLSSTVGLEARRGKCDMLIIDYLQRLSTSQKTDNREAMTAKCSWMIKELALNYGMSVVLLSQLNRNVEHRSGRDSEPQLSDLRASGAIEEDADVVWMLQRSVSGDEEEREVCRLFVRKDRNGPTDDLNLLWNGKCVRFTPQIIFSHRDRVEVDR